MYTKDRKDTKKKLAGGLGRRLRTGPGRPSPEAALNQAGFSNCYLRHPTLEVGDHHALYQFWRKILSCVYQIYKI